MVIWGTDRKRRENLSVKAGQPEFLVRYLHGSWGIGLGQKNVYKHKDRNKVIRAFEETARHKETLRLEQK